jgi:twitching motility protein PilT
MSSSPPLLGRVAVAAKVLTMEQLAQATRHQARVAPDKALGDIFQELGFMDRATLERVLEMQARLVEKARAKKQAEAQREAGAPSGPRDSAQAPVPQPTGDTPPPTAESPHQTIDSGTVTASAPATATSVTSSGGKALHDFLAAAVAKGASDIHIHSGAPPAFRMRGQLEDQSDTPLAPEACEAMVLSMLTPSQRALFTEHGELDFPYSVEGIGRFRTNIYRQLRGIDAVMRSIPPNPPSLQDLGLSPSLARFTNYHQGMVLLTGPSGCGKSSTMAALVNIVNEERAEHILTIEDPIEYLHPSNRCLVNQRNVGKHTESFARALRGALREDPDVIVIGELRDLETISLAMTAAETGHFVLATLHTDSAARTINRMVGVFPADQQDQVRSMLSESLRAVLSQRLLPAADGAGMVPALEILTVTRAAGNLIREKKTVQLMSVMQTGASQGMCLLDQALAQLVQQGKVSYEDAVHEAEDPKNIPKR